MICKGRLRCCNPPCPGLLQREECASNVSSMQRSWFVIFVSSRTPKTRRICAYDADCYPERQFAAPVRYYPPGTITGRACGSKLSADYGTCHRTLEWSETSDRSRPPSVSKFMPEIASQTSGPIGSLRTRSHPRPCASVDPSVGVCGVPFGVCDFSAWADSLKRSTSVRRNWG